MNNILCLNDVHVHYGSTHVLKGINFELKQGDILCLLGPSGCGKTTILKSVAGLLNVSQGSIELNQRCVSKPELNVAPEKRNLGMLFQDYALFPHLSVAKNICYGLNKLSKQAQQARLSELLVLIHLEGEEDKFPHELSGGQQQRVALARSLAYKPDILLLDEPFSNIDNKVKNELIEEVRDIIKQENVAAIFVSHSKEEAFSFADHVAVIEQGLVAQLDKPAELYSRPSSVFVAEFMGLLNKFNLDTCAVEIKRYLNGIPDTKLNNNQSEALNTLAFRPEHIYLVDAQTAGEEGLAVTFIKQRFLGSQSILHVSCYGHELQLYAPVDFHCDKNQALSVRFIKDKVICF